MASEAEGYVQPYSPCTLIMPDGTAKRRGSVRTGKLMTVKAALAALAEQQGRLLGFDQTTHIEAERIAVVIDR